MIFLKKRMGSICASVCLCGCLAACAEKSETYGQTLKVIKTLNIGRCIDATVARDILYVIGQQSIFSFDISSPANPVLLSRLKGLGNVRQIEVENGYAYITARQDGLYIVDVNDPRKMTKAGHYDTLELATGISVSGPLAVVANRQYGIELVDVSNPSKPRFVGLTRTGEAQSVFIKGKLAYVGDWGNRELTVCDISNPYDPRVVSQTPLDGFGDGVFVRDNLCFAATGHHARSMKKRVASDPAFGKGHGVEIFDVSSPQSPQSLSCLKLPSFYQRYIDMWDVQVAGRYAFVGDTQAGLFVIDIRNPQKPSFAAHATFPQVEFRGEDVNAPVGGFALGDGVIYVAGKLTDLSVVEAKGMATPIRADQSRPAVSFEAKSTRPASPSIYRPDGQIHAAFLCEGTKTALVAAGQGGVHEVQLFPQLTGKKLLESKSVAYDVALFDDIMFVAEGLSGLSTWQYTPGQAPVFKGRYTPRVGGVFQILLGPSGKYALLHVGGSIIDIVDIANPQKVKRIGVAEKKGPMYRLPLSQRLLKDRYAGLSIHGIGCFYYDFKGMNGVEYAGQAFPSVGFPNGMAFLRDRAVASYLGGYLLQNPPNKQMQPHHKPIRLKNHVLTGKVTAYGSTLYVSNRMSGKILAVDLSDPISPREKWNRKLTGHPGFVSQCDDLLVVPAGRAGLYVLQAENGMPYYGK
jgi:hypothetical protein